MIFVKTRIVGLFIMKPELHTDSRGYFFRTYCRDEFKKNGINFIPEQMNESYNGKKGIIRGLHFQNNPFSEAKIVRCVSGTIFDVAVDLRRNSPTFGKWFSIELSSNNKYSLYIPKNFAHGYQTLTANTIIEYTMSNTYNMKASDGIRFDDPYLKVSWPMTPTLMNDKDKILPFFKKTNGKK